jgi:gluconate 2-dehydrogenase gamma chain
MLHRRVFLQFLGASTLAVTGVRAQEAPSPPAPILHGAGHGKTAAAATDSGLGAVQKAYSFLTEPEVAFIEAATARLIPADELGGGALEAEVPFFIDQQLSGGFGIGARTYRQGPWSSETGLQGYQLPLSYRELYRIGIAATDQYCQSTHGKRFAQLPPEQQDEVLKGLEDVASDVKLKDVPGATFFRILLQNTKEGFFADPIHGGNQNMIGWKMVGFPGIGGDYRDLVEKRNEPADLEPVGIREMQQGSVDTDKHGHPVHKHADRGAIRSAIKLTLGPGKEGHGSIAWDGTLPPAEVV